MSLDPGDVDNTGPERPDIGTVKGPGAKKSFPSSENHSCTALVVSGSYASLVMDMAPSHSRNDLDNDELSAESMTAKHLPMPLK
jgi:hypothetical protein